MTSLETTIRSLERDRDAKHREVRELDLKITELRKELVREKLESFRLSKVGKSS